MRIASFLLPFLLTVSPACGGFFLYLSDGAGTLRRTQLDGANPTTLHGSVGAPVFLTAGFNALYFSDPAADTLNRINFDGSGLSILASGDGISEPRGLAPDTDGPEITGLYFVNGGTKELSFYNLATKTVTPLLEELGDPWGLVRSGSHLYVVDRDAAQIIRYQIGSGASEVYADLGGYEGLHGITLVPGPFGPTLYVTGANEVLAVDEDQQITSLFDASEANFTGMAASATHLYFVASATEELYQLDLESRTVTVLHDAASLPGLTAPAGLTITPVPFLSIDDQTVTESNPFATFTVTLSKPTPCPLSIPFTTLDDTALAPSDYAPTSGTLTIPAGFTSGTIDVPIVNDGAHESIEAFTLFLSPPATGGILDGLGTCTILARPTINSGKAFTWGQNLGWTNWNTPTNPVHTLTTYLKGWIWNQNVGWITVGHGTPVNGERWDNKGHRDFGINILPGGALSGFAWGQNIGWIAFEQIHGKPLLDYRTGRFSGFAWSQNCGWINLGSETTHYLQTDLLEIVDSDGDQIDDRWELQRVAAAGLATDFPENDLTRLGGSGNADLDPLSDLEEFQHDSDPFSAGSFTRILSVSFNEEITPREVNVSWSSSPDRLYDLLESPSPALPFTDLFLDLPGAPAKTTATFQFPAGPDRSFWKVGVRRPLAP